MSKCGRILLYTYHNKELGELQMKYRTNKMNGDNLSILGLGCMRFPKDYKDSERLILGAIEKGVNYFDTAYIYPNSEATLGKVLNQNNKRADVKIATKIMPTLIKKHSDLDKYFAKQLIVGLVLFVKRIVLKVRLNL